MKKITKKQKGQIWNEVDNEGLDYWIINYSSDYDNTELGPNLKIAREALESLQSIINSYEEYASLED